MDRRRFLLTSVVGAIASPAAAGAEQTKVFRVACLWASPAERVEPYRKALLGGLEARGWIDGRNIVIDHRYPQSPDDLPRLVAELLAAQPDVLVAATNPVIEIARRATSSVPIVMLYVINPVASGFVKSLARPGTNLTGLTFDPAPSLFAKNVAFLKELIPRATEIGMLWNPQAYSIRAMSIYIDEVTDHAKKLGLKVRSLQVVSIADVERTFERLASNRYRLDGLVVIPDAFVTFQHFPRIAKLCLSHRLPSIYGFREYVEAGGLLSYGPSTIEQPRYVAAHIDRLLRGAKVADIPIEQPSTYELVINLKTAKALGLTIPSSLLLRADQVIE